MSERTAGKSSKTKHEVAAEETVASHAAVSDTPELADEVSVEISAIDMAAITEERPAGDADAELKAVLEAIVYITDEPLSAQQISAALEKPIDLVQRLLSELVTEYAAPSHGLSIREVAGGYKMATKAEHHEAVRGFVKKLTPPLKLSLAALETLAVIAYKQPVTTPEIMDIRGVQGASVLKTLLDRKLVAEAGRKNVVGKPILYKTTKEFLVQFGLKSVNELPTLKEFEELARMSVEEETVNSEAASTDSDAETPAESAKTAEVETETPNADVPLKADPPQQETATPETEIHPQHETTENQNG